MFMILIFFAISITVQSMKLMFLPSNRLYFFVIEGAIMQTGKKSSLLLVIKTCLTRLRVITLGARTFE